MHAAGIVPSRSRPSQTLGRCCEGIPSGLERRCQLVQARGTGNTQAGQARLREVGENRMHQVVLLICEMRLDWLSSPSRTLVFVVNMTQWGLPAAVENPPGAR